MESTKKITKSSKTETEKNFKTKYVILVIYGNFVYKGKMNKWNINILINAVLIGMDLCKIGIAEPKVGDTLVYLTPTWSK